ncbi:MAG TPA: TonB-dependent receptor plug domain-containing protein, partial [Chitinophagaceae bacterium]|nr:TonB-dependent receptor plug domain-containing protein [Chitinophagaceae bacterium]
MKRIFLLSLLAINLLTGYSQIVLRGRVLEKVTGKPLAAASITIANQSTISNEYGVFELKLKAIGNPLIEVSHVEHQSLKDSLSKFKDANGPKNGELVIYMVRKNLFLQPVEVLATRSGTNAPFTKTNLTKKEIEKLNLGQDLPFILNQTPATVVSSDAGNGIGYTGLRIRGADLSRINVTLNGVPYNDPESQGVFFVDMPDVASSVNSIQIQRGVGTSSNGAGAFGATINIGTNEFNEKPYAEINSSYGSFNSWKTTVKAGSGLLNDHFTLDARLSRITSQGYIDRASSELHSFSLSGAYLNKNTQVRMNVIGGKEKTYQAWYGVPESLLSINRTYNAAGTEKPGEPYNNETDNYQQDHYQFFLNHSFNPKLAFNLVLFYTKGKGYYEQYKASQNFSEYGLNEPVIGSDTIASTDLIRQLWLDNNFYGNVFSFQYKENATQLTLGGGWNNYDGEHFGRVIWSAIGFPKDFEWYRLDATKKDFNIYGKWQQKLNDQWESFADLQYRKVNYDLNGFRNNPGLQIKNDYDFINPKLGLSYRNQNWRGYFSYALANKEPNRDDFEASAEQQPLHETLHDFELGLERNGIDFDWSAVGYFMHYHNQLVLTGKINDVGAYTRTNIPKSYRMGIELQFTYRPVTQVRWDLNFALSENKVLDFTEFVDDYDDGVQKINTYQKTDISFSPAAIAGSTISYNPLERVQLALISKYVGQQYLDNTSNSDRKLDAYFLNDLRLSYSIVNKLFKEVNI